MSRGIFTGKTIQVEGSPWSTGAPRVIGKDSLTAKILCTAHNNKLSDVDAAGIRAFRAIREIDNGLAKGRWKGLSPPTWTLSGLMLERWFTKTAINFFVVAGTRKKWHSGELNTSPPLDVVQWAFGLAAPRRPQGLYNWAGRQVGEHIRVADQIGFTPVYRDNVLFVGAQFVFQGLSFLIWLDASPPPWAWLRDFYHHMGGELRQGGVVATLELAW